MLGEQRERLAAAALERQPSCEHAVERDRHRVDIGAAVDRIPRGLLGRGVAGGAEQPADLCRRRAGGVSERSIGLHQTEVDHHRRRRSSGGAHDENVAGLDVPVDVALLVDLVQGLDRRHEQLDRLTHGHAPAPILAQVLLEVGAVEQLHGDERGAVERAGAKHPHDI